MREIFDWIYEKKNSNFYINHLHNSAEMFTIITRPSDGADTKNLDTNIFKHSYMGRIVVYINSETQKIGYFFRISKDFPEIHHRPEHQKKSDADRF